MESSLNGGGEDWKYTWKSGEETPRHIGGQLLEDQLKIAWQEVSISGY